VAGAGNSFSVGAFPRLSIRRLHCSLYRGSHQTIGCPTVRRAFEA
jgi:hypothetical protein